MKTQKKILLITVCLMCFKVFGQYNYYNFTLNQSPFSSTGNGLLLSPGNELYFRSSYGYMGLVSFSGTSWNQAIIWGTQVPKTTSEIIFGDNKVFYIDENNRLRSLYWQSNAWQNFELNSSAPAASGEGLVWAGNSTIYYTTTTGTICKMYYVGAPTNAWNYTNITSIVNAKTGSRLTFGDNKIFYADVNSRLRSLYWDVNVWRNYELNYGSPPASGTGIAFGINSNLFYTGTNNMICNASFSGTWTVTEIPGVTNAKTGSKLVNENNTIFYVGSDNYLYTLFQDNCDWFNKKIDKSVMPKESAICFGNGQVFFRNGANDYLFNAKTPTSVTQSYTYLKGKTFYNGSSPFYPVVMNYIVDLNSDDANPDSNSIGNLWVSPHHEIYPTNICPATDQTTADALLLADFQRLINLGFNTIRICGLAAKYNATGTEDTKIDILHSPNAGYPYQANYTSNNKNKLFTTISHLLSLANSTLLTKQLKVILLAGDGYVERKTAAWSNYASYLGDLGNTIKTDPALFAYDICNEPTNRHAYDDDPSNNIGKADFCADSKAWYDAIRVYDKNHLITMGTYGADDLPWWDPSILSVDFYSFHNYSKGYNTNLNTYEDGYLAQLKWIHKNIKLPWIIGETSVSAIDNTICPGASGWNFEFEQEQFAIYSQVKARSAGGSGYSWWAYHDITHDNTSPSHAFEGIYRLCDDTPKPVADEFDANTHNWLSYPCNNLPDPSHLTYYGYDLNTAYTYTFTGTVKDNATQQGIVDAIVTGYDHDYLHTYTTFTKANGIFSICSNTPIERLDVSALGKEYKIIYYPCNVQPPASCPNYFQIGNVNLNSVGCTISNNVRQMVNTQVEQNVQASAEVYPNPSHDHIMVKTNFKLPFKIEINDMLGRKLYEQNYDPGNTEVKIDYNEQILNNNIVIMKISNGITTTTKKILIMR